MSDQSAPPPPHKARRYFGLGLAWRLKSFWQRLASRAAHFRETMAASSLGAWRHQQPPPVAESVLAWCQQTAHLPYEILLTPAPVHRQPPQTIEPLIHERFLQRLVYTPPVKYLTCIPRARLTGYAGWLVLPTGEYALELAFGFMEHLRDDPGYAGPRPRRRTRMSGNYYSLMMLWATTSSYYHWVHHSLLRLYGILERLPADIRFIVPANLRPFQRESLQALNIRADQLALYTGDEEWELERLYFSPPTSRSGHDIPEADYWLRDRMRAAYGIRPPAPSRRIFVSRRASRGRLITNEAEVEACLHPLGFETFLLEDLSFGEQVRLFAEAESVVGSHGAGFTNIIFANEGLRVVDIFEPQYVNTCFWTMSEALKFRYAYFFGQTVPSPGTNANMVVPIDKLLATLSAFGYA